MTEEQRRKAFLDRLKKEISKTEEVLAGNVHRRDYHGAAHCDAYLQGLYAALHYFRFEYICQNEEGFTKEKRND